MRMVTEIMTQGTAQLSWYSCTLVQKVTFISEYRSTHQHRRRHRLYVALDSRLDCIDQYIQTSIFRLVYLDSYLQISIFTLVYIDSYLQTSMYRLVSINYYRYTPTNIRLYLVYSYQLAATSLYISCIRLLRGDYLRMRNYDTVVLGIALRSGHTRLRCIVV